MTPLLYRYRWSAIWVGYIAYIITVWSIVDALR